MWWPERPRLLRKRGKDDIDAGDALDTASWFGGDIADGLAALALIALAAGVVLLLFTVVIPVLVLGIDF